MSQKPRSRSPRLAVRAVIVQDNALLLVNAWPEGVSDLMCAPGGGVEPHASLHDNLKREVFEETGLQISVGDLCLLNEFHDPDHDFHQVDMFFRCTITAGTLDTAWKDPENIVGTRQWVDQSDLHTVRFKPDCLAEIAFAETRAVSYDALERIVR